LTYSEESASKLPKSHPKFYKNSSRNC